jgi:ABC-type glycerol-3-phosphate transport system substrate-binding protein
MFKKLIIVVMILSMFAMTATSCNQTAAPTTKGSTASGQTTAATADTKIGGSIEFMTYRDDLLNSHYPTWFESFSAKYPNVTIKTSTSKSYDQDLKIRMAANNMPDVFTLNTTGYAETYKEQYMQALDDIFPELVSLWVGNECNVHYTDKKTYGLTFGGVAFGLAYNKVMFNEMGLTPPKTLDELIETARKIKAAGKIGLSGGFKAAFVTTPYWRVAQALMEDQKAEFDKMTASDTPFTVDSSYGMMAGVLLKLSQAGIMEDDPLSYDWEAYLKDFGSNKIGMSFIYSGTPVNYPGRGDGSMKLEDIGYVPFPYDNSGGPYTTLLMPDHSLILSNSTKNPEAAKAFYQWHMGEIYPEYSKTTAAISAKKGVVTAIPYLEEFDKSQKKVVTSIQYPTDFKALLDKAQINFSNQFVEIVAGTSVQDEFNKMNEAWKKARGN